MKTIFPHDLCFWIGYVIIAITVLAISLWILCYVSIFLYRKIWMNDWFGFYIRRLKIPTEKLRDAYAAIKMNRYWTRYTAKYRLRNIRASK